MITIKQNKLIRLIKKVCIFLIMSILTIILFIGVIIALSLIQENLIIGSGFDIWIVVEPYNHLIFILEVLIIWGAICIASRINRGAESEDVVFYKYLFRLIKKYKIVCISVMAMMIYLILINVVSIKGDKIVVYSTFSPFGREYTFGDIEEIEVGFGEKTYFSPVQNEGVFYYNVTLKDGTKFDVNNFGGEGKEYQEDTYLSLEYIDTSIMLTNKNLVKKTSLDNIEHAYLDQRYIDRFKRIIDNVKS